MKTNNRKTFMYLMTLTAFVTVAAMGFLLTTFNGGIASAQERADNGQNIKGYQYDLTPEMISYALNYKSTDLNVRYEIMNQLPCMEIASSELGGRTLKAGVYCVPNANIAGELNLDGSGDASSVFIFRVAGALTTKDGAGINLMNAAQAANVHFVADTARIASGTDFKGSVLADRAITVEDGATVKGRLNSVKSEINAPAGAEAPSAPGFIEICKAAAAGSGGTGNAGLGGRTFTFDITNGPGQPLITVTVPVGSCSPAIAVEAGTQTITERNQGSNTTGGFALTAVNVLSSSSTSTLGAVNLSTRTATVNVVAGSTSSELVLQFVNRTAITGFIEICKEASRIGTDLGVGATDPDVSGMFTFNIEGVFTTNQANPGVRTLQNFTAAPGQCTGAIAVTIPTDGFPPSAVARVTELGRDSGVFLELALSNDPAGPAVYGSRVNANGGISSNPGGGFIPVNVQAAADPSNETLVFFFNRSTPGLVKICKIAGPGIPIGEPFTFEVNGTTSTPPGPAQTAVVNRRVTVLAGPAAQGGNCTFVPGVEGGLQTFVIGSNVRVDELGPRTITQNNTANGNRPGQVFTSRITTSTGQGTFDLNRTETRISRATFAARREVVIVTFTNFTFRPAFLKICKIGTGAVIGQTFNFNVRQEDTAGIGLPPLNIPVQVTAQADNGQGGGCTIVGGLFNTVNFNANGTITVTEGAAPGTTLTAITSSTSIGGFTTDLTNRRATFTNGLREAGEVTINIVTFTNTPSVPGTGPAPVRFDFDGDGKADLSTFRTSNGTWYLQESTNGFRAAQFGTSGDLTVPADFDGDGKTDIAVYRGGTWFIMGSTSGFRAVSFGSVGDIPQAGDFDGDGSADVAVFRPSNGTWYIMGSTAGFSGVQFGATGDRAVAGDYDGDGRMDVAVYRGGTWFINGSTTGFNAMQFGNATDKPTPADFDGDGKTDIAVFRSGVWYIMGSTGGFRAAQFGQDGDIPTAADYNGDGKADIAVFRGGMWFILDSDNGGGVFRAVQFGEATDKPVPASF